MLLLLPPSEGKTRPAHGAPVDLASLSYPELTEPRSSVLDRLIAVSAQPDAAQVLGVGASLAGEVAANTGLRTAPAARAAALYTGVLYAAAGLADLSGTARRRAGEHVRIFSGLWGVLSPEDQIPAYRLAMGVQLPGLTGKLSAFWKPHLSAALQDQPGGVVVDCRSAPYTAAWRPPTGAEHVTVQVVRERDGKRQVVSHNAKRARGALAHHLLTRENPLPAAADDLATAAEEMIGDDAANSAGAAGPAGTPGTAEGTIRAIELGEPLRGRRTLTLVERG